jgi:hypothetical protein
MQGATIKIKKRILFTFESDNKRATFDLNEYLMRQKQYLVNLTYKFRF